MQGRIRSDTAREFLLKADVHGDGRISRQEWVRAIRAQEDVLWRAFERLGGEGAAPSAATIHSAFEPYFEEPEQLARFVPVAFTALSGEPLTFSRFQGWVKEYRLETLNLELEQLRNLDTGHEAQVQRPSNAAGSSSGSTAQLFAAGLLAGVVSRTATAPGERIKVLLATGQLSGPFWSWGRTLRALVAAEGVATFCEGRRTRTQPAATRLRHMRLSTLC